MALTFPARKVDSPTAAVLAGAAVISVWEDGFKGCLDALEMMFAKAYA
jgi:hypothetical protein